MHEYYARRRKRKTLMQLLLSYKLICRDYRLNSRIN